jgi:DNA-binding LacI/PurR family transcriptional regulator
MPLTQKEIVDKLGISRGTLHRVLSNSPLVKGATRERILRELKDLNYEPNVLAQGLKTRSTRSIGLIGPSSLRMSNIDKLNAIYLAARNRGYSITLGYSNGTAEEDAECIRKLRARMVDGFIALGRGLQETVPVYKDLIDRGIPLVTLYPLPDLETDCVYVDTGEAYKRLTQYLISLGHEKIGLLINDSRSEFTLNREIGFRAAMKEADLAINENWVVHATSDGEPAAHDEAGEIRIWGTSDYYTGYWGLSGLLKRKNRPSAVLCLSDEGAIGALKAADEADCHVPADIAIVGYDNKDCAEFARVPLTTMHQPDDEVGEGAVSLLIDRIEKRLTNDPVNCPIQASLVVRESCGAKLKNGTSFRNA